MIRLIGCLSVAILCCITSVSEVRAVPMTYNVSFSASSFGSFTADPAPVDPVTGSFTITLDPTVTTNNQTTGIVLHTLNIALGSALGYAYDHSTQTLVVGGVQTDVRALSLISSDDFKLEITNFVAGPVFSRLEYTQASVGGFNYFLTSTGSASVSSPVPEPATVLLLAAGFVGVGGWRFRVGRDEA